MRSGSYTLLGSLHGPNTTRIIITIIIVGFVSSVVVIDLSLYFEELKLSE